MCPHWSRKGRRSAQYTTTYSAASTAIAPYGCRENFSSSLDFNVKVEIEVQIAKMQSAKTLLL